MDNKMHKFGKWFFGFIFLTPVLFFLLGILVLIAGYFGIIEGVDPHGDGPIDLDKGYYWCNKNMYKKDKAGNSKVIIDQWVRVNDFTYNEKFIEVYQDYDDEYPDLLKDKSKCDTTPEYKRFFERTKVKSQYFQQMKKQKRFYYLIDKDKDKIYGPMTKQRLYFLEDSLHTDLHLER